VPNILNKFVSKEVQILTLEAAILKLYLAAGPCLCDVIPSNPKLAVSRKTCNWLSISERKNVISIREFWLCARLQVWRNWREFRRSRKQKCFWTLYIFAIFPISSSILTSLKKYGEMFSWGINFFRTKLTYRRFPKPSFSRGIQEISLPRSILSTTLFTYCIHISNPLNI